MFRSCSLRMYSTVLRHPDKIFTTVLPPPPSWPAPTSLSPSPTGRKSPSLHWKESELGDKTLTGVLSNLQCTLRSVHKRKIFWPVEESSSSSRLTPSEYFMTLLRPIPEIFNQLHSPHCLATPMKCISIDFGPSIYGATFKFESWSRAVPIVLLLSDNLFDSSGKVSSHVEHALSLALEHTSSATVIVTNFKDIAIFFPSTSNRREPTFERISTTQPSLALRVLATAYLLDAGPRGFFIEVPRPDMEMDDRDEQMDATYHRYSDEFDMETLIRDREKALIFFRWQDHWTSKFSKFVARPNDTLTAQTDRVTSDLDIRPIYPFDASEISSDTAAHLKATQRKSLLVTAGVAKKFKRSHSFKLVIQEIVSEGSEGGICTVYRCKITSIDNVPVSVSPLCLKLFDHRFEDEDDEYNDKFISGVYAEFHALNEAFAYDKLRPVQGSVIPWFYGTHQFRLPDGATLTGHLMEYVDGWDLNFGPKYSPDKQIKMIQSCRHAARVLDVADVSQRDWHGTNVILYTNPTTKLNHAVLIDFASTTQTYAPHELNYNQNYFSLLDVLLGNQGDVVLDPKLVWGHYGEPDDWDPIQASIPTDSEGKCMKIVEAKNMFPYISST